MTSSELGTIGELKAQSYLLSKGIEIYIPVVDAYQADLIIVINGQFKRVQVKSTEKVSKGCATYDFRRKSRTNGLKNQDAYDNVDYYILYCLENDYLGIIDASKVGATLSLRFTGGNVLSKFAEDYCIENAGVI